MSAPKIIRYRVRRDGSICRLHPIVGISKSAGILLPGETPEQFANAGRTLFRDEGKAQKAIDRTERAARRVRTSLVSEFIHAKAPELRPLFTDGKFYIERVELDQKQPKRRRK